MRIITNKYTLSCFCSFIYSVSFSGKNDMKIILSCHTFTLTLQYYGKKTEKEI